MRLHRVAPPWYASEALEGAYRGHRVEIERLGRGRWVARIDGQTASFDSLAQARRECQHAIDYAANAQSDPA
jgi:hypothetical protein